VFSGTVVTRGRVPGRPHALQEGIASAERAINQTTLPAPEVFVDPAQASQDNASTGIEDRRALITACLDKVVIRPAARPGTYRFDPLVSVVTRAGELLAVVQTSELGHLQDRTGIVRLKL
jgi:hypothetical protein